jgi:hypothetical protein
MAEVAVRLRRERQGLIGIITPAALFWTAHTLSNQSCCISSQLSTTRRLYTDFILSHSPPSTPTPAAYDCLFRARHNQSTNHRPTPATHYNRAAAQLGDTSDIAASSSDILPGPNSIAADCISKRCDSNCASNPPLTHTYHRHGRS